MNFDKENYISEINKCILSSIIYEYDIEKANACALRIIQGDGIYNKLINMDKNDRVIYVGKMIRNNNNLYKSISNLLLNWRNEFIELNKIKTENIIELTRDSILFKNIIPKITTLPKYDFVNFRTKGEEYSSYIYLNPQLRILYDSLKKHIKIKGIKDDVVNKSSFIKKILIPILQILEDSVSMGYSKSFNSLKKIREKYLNNDDAEIYRDILNNNRIIYNKYGETIESDYVLPDEHEFIDKRGNYMNFVFPLLVLKN